MEKVNTLGHVPREVLGWTSLVPPGTLNVFHGTLKAPTERDWLGWPNEILLHTSHRTSSTATVTSQVCTICIERLSQHSPAREIVSRINAKLQRHQDVSRSYALKSCRLLQIRRARSFVCITYTCSDDRLLVSISSFCVSLLALVASLPIGQESTRKLRC